MCQKVAIIKMRRFIILKKNRSCRLEFKARCFYNGRHEDIDHGGEWTDR